MHAKIAEVKYSECVRTYGRHERENRRGEAALGLEDGRGVRQRRGQRRAAVGTPAGDVIPFSTTK